MNSIKIGNSTNANNTQSYKCTNCGAPINYKPGMTSVYCEYCNHHSVISYNKSTKEKPEKVSSSHEEVFDLKKGKIIICHKCRAGYKKDENAKTIDCIFCNADIYNSYIYNWDYVEPSHILPFQISEEQFIENLKDWIKKNKLPTPSPFGSSKKISNICINSIYAPFWINDINDPIEEKELLDPKFDYKKAFISASPYIPSQLVDTLAPWDRKQLILKKEEDLNKYKSLLFYAIPQEEENIIELMKYEREIQAIKYKFSSRKIQKFSLILLPIHECHYTYKKNVYKIYGNGYTGKIGRDPYAIRDEKSAHFNKIFAILACIFILTILIIITILVDKQII